MRFLLLGLILCYQMPLSWASCTSEDVANAEKRLRIQESLFKQGWKTRQDIESAQAHLLELQYCHGDISQNDYCQKRRYSLRQRFLKSTTSPHKNMALLSERNQLGALCGPPSDIQTASLANKTNDQEFKCSEQDAKAANERVRKLAAMNPNSPAKTPHLSLKLATLNNETQFCAGKRDEVQYCQQAFVLLKRRYNMLKKYPAGKKKKLMQQVADMRIRCDKVLNGQEAVMQLCADQDISEAQKYSNGMEALYAQRNATKSEVAASKTYLQNVQLCRGQSSIADYCASNNDSSTSMGSTYCRSRQEQMVEDVSAPADDVAI